MRSVLIATILLITAFGTQAQQEAKPVDKSGIASYYHDKFVGRKTATGEVFSNGHFTAACNTLRLGTYVKVTNLTNGKVVYVRINDRMNAANTRLIDLARVAAEQLGFKNRGITNVKVDIVTKEEGKTGILAQREVPDTAPANQL
ncbi:MAG: septal ring lytic transglycosylase RlpA family protein [Taibaiella sp.]|nr:septal ring lytic transglycosylase RlpA family protein [Taibaiella sp.]